jgi:AraC family ethanolamine operon transcriptional activator
MNPLDFPIQVSCLNSSFHQFHEAVKAWNIDFIQLGSGQFKADLIQVIYPDIHLASAHFNSAVKQEGVSPEGFWTFAFVNDKKLHWRNYLVQPQSIIIYSSKSKINAVSSPGFDVRIISISEKYLLKYCNDCGLDLSSKFESLLIVKPEPKKWLEFYTTIKDITENPTIKEPLHLVKPLVSLVTKSTPDLNEISPESRLNLLTSAETYIHNNITSSLNVTSIAKECLVSERTLLYAFKQRFGIGPKAFIKIIKLNEVHKKLSENREGMSISQTAKSYGFWHMSQFHQDYKSFFGNLPSETKV